MLSTLKIINPKEISPKTTYKKIASLLLSIKISTLIILSAINAFFYFFNINLLSSNKRKALWKT